MEIDLNLIMVITKETYTVQSKLELKLNLAIYTHGGFLPREREGVAREEKGGGGVLTEKLSLLKALTSRGVERGNRAFMVTILPMG